MTEFSRTLSLLRREQGVSQRKAASDLGVSQALLSHYENGIREPGLAFVVRACDYYRVSADYLLARTLSRDGGLSADELLSESDGGKPLRGGVLATIRGKLLAGAVEVLFGLLGRLDEREAVNAAADALNARVYDLYRALHRASGGDAANFSLREEEWNGGAAGAEELRATLRYRRILRALAEEGADFPDLSHEAMNEAFPGKSQGLTQVLSAADAQLSRAFAEE